MTAPDPTPYLLPTDLRTAEDVDAWIALDFDDAYPAGMLRLDLRARLDCERRQACERGAEDCERRARELCPDGDYTRGPSMVPMQLMARALAFRAAARAK